MKIDVSCDAQEDETFSLELRRAQDTASGGDGYQAYARVLSGRLRQMDRRSRQANARADRLQSIVNDVIKLVMRDES